MFHQLLERQEPGGGGRQGIPRAASRRLDSGRVIGESGAGIRGVFGGRPVDRPFFGLATGGGLSPGSWVLGIDVRSRM
jgi:hypothetical protein